jgi:hypothetical protein
MQDKTIRYDAHVPRRVHDFEARDNQPHTVMDWDPPRETSQEVMNSTEMEFTTEWQMAAAAESRSSD